MWRRMRRRGFLRLLGWSSLLAWARAAGALPTGAPPVAPDSLAALPAYLDTLIPADGGPSATALGVDDALRAAARAEESYANLLAAGCRWLDLQARQRGGSTFRTLPEEARVAIATQAQDARPGSGEWTFYQKVRADAFRHYYADARSWQSVGVARAPQPAGYPDFAEPPTSAGDA